MLLTLLQQRNRVAVFTRSQYGMSRDLKKIWVITWYLVWWHFLGSRSLRPLQTVKIYSKNTGNWVRLSSFTFLSISRRHFKVKTILFFRKFRVPANQTSIIIGNLTSGLRYWWTVYAARGLIKSEPRRDYIDIGKIDFPLRNWNIQVILTVT